MDDKKKQPNYLLGLFVVVQLLFLIIIGVVISNISTSNNITSTPNAFRTARVVGLPASFSEDTLHTIGNSFYSLMLENTESKELLESDVVVVVNEGSETSLDFEERGITLFSAVLSANELGQTYKLFYGYPTKANVNFQEYISILCIESPSMPCVSSPNSSELIIAQSFLPFIDFEKFTVFFDEEDPYLIKINSILGINDNKEIEMSYIDDVKAGVKALGLSPDLFKYQVLTAADYTFYLAD